MSLPTIFDVCEPRADVLAGSITESDFAADLAQVIRGTAPAEYADPLRFFENTYPTRGLQNLLANVCRRLSGAGGEAASIFRLDTQYGGGKTHGLIALVHAARGMAEVPNVAEFVDPALLPRQRVRVAAFDGENADPANGRTMGEGIRAHTPWGEIAYALAGADGYERVRTSDEQRVAPGADTLRELFAGEPALILLDELSIYLRKVQGMVNARDQLSAFLTSLFKAVESTSNAAIVFTLAVGRDRRATDAYGGENEFIANRMAELESISARKATLLNPTEEDETAQVLRRRLFARIDETRVPAIVDGYRALWRQNEGALSQKARRSETAEAFQASYPFHPDLLDTLTEKTATLSNFHRVRGMLRLLAATVGRAWQERPGDAYAIHLHHVNLAHEPIRQELITRLGLGQYAPALGRDVAGDPATPSLARELDELHYRGIPPYATYAARTIFIHTLAYNEPLRGLTADELRYSMLGPAIDPSFVDDAWKRFVSESAFLDDRPGAPLRFLAEANLNQIIRRQEAQVDPEEVRTLLRDRIREIFSGGSSAVFNLVPFPSAGYEVPDDVGDGRPQLAVLGYDAASIGGSFDTVPQLVARIFERKGADDRAVRLNRNALVFVVADEARKEEMRHQMARRLALQELKTPARLGELAEHQQEKVRGLEAQSQSAVAVAIQQCYRHVFYPARANRVNDRIDLAHTTIDLPTSSASPGSGQRQIEQVLRDNNKLRVVGDEPNAPTYIRDLTPLKKGEITTRELREEFRRDPALPMLVGDDVFLRGIRRGVEQGEYVYRHGALLYGQGDPQATIAVSEESVVFTMAYAVERGIWPRPIVPAPRPVPDAVTPPGAGGAREGGIGPTTDGKELLPPPPPPVTPDLHAEGVLSEALAELWMKVRSRKHLRIDLLKVRVFDWSDAFGLLRAIGTVARTSKQLRLDGEYESAEGGVLRFDFTGPVADAQPLREFLEPQLRAAKDARLEATIELRFDDGLTMSGDAPEQLAEKLTRHVSGSAFVTASAEVVGGAAVRA